MIFNGARCSSLWETIKNIDDQIAKRLGELDEDPQGLPEMCPGDDTKPSLSKRGHRKIVEKLKAQRAQRVAEFLSECGALPGMPGSNPKGWNYWIEALAAAGLSLAEIVAEYAWLSLFAL